MVARMAEAGALARLVLVLGLIALAQLALARVVGAGEAAGHATLHALTVLPLIVISGLLVWRWPDAGAAVRAPALGLAALTIAMLVESFGAYGFNADNDTRNGFAVVHDLGLELTSLGLVAAVAGVGLGFVALSMRRRGIIRGIGLAASLAAIAVGVLGVKSMIGL